VSDAASHRGVSPDDPQTISSTLLEQVKSRRPEAWRRLADLYGPVVYRWCRQSGVTRDDAPDLVQEVFVALTRHVGGFHRDRPDGSFAAWLRTVTRNVVRDHYRARHERLLARGGTNAQEQILQLPNPPDPESADASAEITGFVAPRALELIRAEFEDRTWEAFRRAVLDKQPPARIALELGMSLPAVYQAKSRVLRRLRRELDGLLE
jgi:RNA polymerase sigma-70 factor, ECF subfamily